ncbi:Neuropeptide B [Galemys pyrenaicus]|uniref:Neuropeptide B n=1 Tax=Galemys pyrenaicus TaxID=202257 RepID=A0A8J6DH57_GALPY|nr:Neuropeptide B [Galemys pyrenaicus]
MARPATLLAAALVLCLLRAPPGLAWYKPAAGRSHYSVGRAAGLLSGFHRAPYARRSDSAGGTGQELRTGLRRSLALCVQAVTPNLQSCERLPDSRATFQCRADVFLSLRGADCRDA